MNKVFVYGTLASGKQVQEVLPDLSGEWVEATINGALVNAG